MGFTRSRAVLLAMAPWCLPFAALEGQTIISGFVRDSLVGTPLSGATIQLVPSATPWAAGRTARSDSIGRYRLDSVAPGTYVVGFQHPRLDTLGMDAVSRTLEVAAGMRVMRADLALPSGRTFVTSLCGAVTDSSGAVIGRVFDSATGNPVPDGSVVVRWAEMRIGGAGVTREMRQTVTRFGVDGRYVACGVPTGAPVLVSARAGAGDALNRTRCEQRDRTVVHDALTPCSTRTFSSPCESRPWRRNRVPLRRQPTARWHEPEPHDCLAASRRRTVRPCSGARVQVLDTDLTATTDSTGAFRLAGLPGGTRAVEVTAIGYTPSRTSADLRPDRDAAVNVNVGARVATLTAVDVVSTAPDRSGFLKRRAQGNGYFLDGNMLEQRGAQNVSQALVTAPSLRGNGFDTQNPTRPIVSGRSNCKPTAYLDGQVMRDGLAGVDDLLTVRRVGGIEVYANPTEAPPQFRANGTCAVILVWTRAYVP